MNFDFYFKNQKKLFFIPLILIVIAFIIIGLKYSEVGDIVEKDVSLKGGITATIYIEKNVPDLNSILSDKLNSEVIVRTLQEFGTEKQQGIIIETDNLDESLLRNALEEELNIDLGIENFSVEITGSSLGEAFYRQMSIAILVAFILMALVVFIAFRSFIPSLAVVLAAFSDMLITIAMINVLEIRISTAGIAAILLLLGYSVDTDILMTTKVLKRKEGDIKSRMISSMKTGLTMSITTIVALTIGYIFSTSLVLREMFLIIVVGLIIDIIMTYLLNGYILLSYVRKRENA